jgi:hypothetical protein
MTVVTLDGVNFMKLVRTSRDVQVPSLKIKFLKTSFSLPKAAFS